MRMVKSTAVISSAEAGVGLAVSSTGQDWLRR